MPKTRSNTKSNTMSFQSGIPRSILPVVSLLLILALACGGETATATPPPTTASVATATNTPTATPAVASDEVVVPIRVRGARNLGTLHIELVYDSSTLQVIKFEPGELARNALSESNFDAPGRVIIGIVDTDGIDGDGPVGLLTFKVLGSRGQSALTLDNVVAHDATRLIDVPTVVGVGTFNLANRSFDLPDISFAGSN